MNFEPENQPRWRSSGLRTEELIDDIVTFRDKFEKLHPIDKQFCRGSFSSSMAVEFIYHINVSELIGSQTKERIEELIRSISERREADQSDIETLNIYAAMKKLHQIFKDEMYGFLTVQQICDVHRVLMKGLLILLVILRRLKFMQFGVLVL